jgi:hypothetical protein
VTGELVGFLPPAVVGAVLATTHAPDAVLVAALTVAGVAEGAALGVAQASVLARHLPAIDRRAWIGATATAAGVAWFAGMGGSAVVGAPAVPLAVGLTIAVPAWTIGLLSMGYLQWRVLRRAVPASGRWVGVTSAAWAVGVMIPVAVLSAVPNGWPAAVRACAGVLGAVAMGATVGALTGRTLARLVAGARDLRPFRPDRPRQTLGGWRATV